MNKKEFLVIYEEWLRNVNQDILWFSHRLDELVGDAERTDEEITIARGLFAIRQRVNKVRPSIEYKLAKHLTSTNISKSLDD